MPNFMYVRPSVQWELLYISRQTDGNAEWQRDLPKAIGASSDYELCLQIKAFMNIFMSFCLCVCLSVCDVVPQPKLLDFSKWRFFVKTVEVFYFKIFLSQSALY